MENLYILAKGMSMSACPKREDIGANDEMWGLNGVYRDRPDIDKLFILHDIRTVALAEDHNVINNLNDLDVDIYTNTPVHPLDRNICFPAEEVANRFGIEYFLNVICWMIAYAITQKPKHIFIYGADYVYGVDINEKACTEWWLGVAFGMGIGITIPDGSSLLKPPDMRQPYYGYIIDRKEPDGLLNILRPHLKNNNTEFAKEYELVPLDREEARVDL